MRRFLTINTSDKGAFIIKLSEMMRNKDVFMLINPHNYKVSGYGKFEPMAYIGKVSEYKSISVNDYNNLERYISGTDDFINGFLSYDLKNQSENLKSDNFDGLDMPLMHFFQPEFTFRFMEKNKLEVGYLPERINEAEVIDLCGNIERGIPDVNEMPNRNIALSCRVLKPEYLENINKIKEHIQLGDVYELNYCIEFFAENAEIEPLAVYEKLSNISPAPFSCFYKVDNMYLICASPERFLKKEGNKIIAQPMKGTARRSNDTAEDTQIKEQLIANEKERAENVMIVDLVRNDLSKTALQQSVKVDELFGVFSFPQVHQMVSTVSSEMRDDVDSVDVIKSAFPMGSMTGAPKVKAMELIEKFETTRRGLFSGAAGYFTPEGDFDFNVVIRSIQYNADKKYLSFMVGSAITINSDPEKEYEECLLKAKALIEALK